MNLRYCRKNRDAAEPSPTNQAGWSNPRSAPGPEQPVKLQATGVLLALKQYDAPEDPMWFWFLPEGGADHLPESLVDVTAPDFDTVDDALNVLAELAGSGEVEVVLGSEMGNSQG
ncbi:MAG TPA: hypothetical protein VN442_10525 [Bryobacteraceae bacterium]|nr:hypothetical protein [Bryobacteraceae bacterium]